MRLLNTQSLDLDVWVSTDPNNAQAVFDVLKSFGAPLEGMTADDFAQDGYFYQMGIPPIRIDVLMGEMGLPFDEAWERRTTVNFDDTEVIFIGKQDLITSKKASGRPQDLLDIDSLENAGE